MSRQYREHYTRGSHTTMRFRMGDPFGNQRRVEADMKRQFDEQAAKNANLPEKSAEEMHDDRQVFIGLINGVLIGGVLIGVGGLIGAMITRLVLWVNGRKEKTEKQDKNNQTHI
jgi:nucleoside recognition membrane protein YjiH